MVSIRYPRSFRVVIVNMLVLLAGLLAMEFLFGNWLKPNRMNRLNLVRKAYLSYDAGHLYPSSHPQITYTRDAFGFRGPHPPNHAIDILTIGGSTTDQRYITDGETWQDVLRDDFFKEGKNVVVVNAGVDGQSTVGHIKNFDWWFPFVPGLKVKYFLFYLGVNDFFIHEDFDDLVRQPSLKTRVKESSVLYSLYSKIKGLYNARVVSKVGHRAIDFAHVAWTDVPLLKNYDELMRPSLASYRDRLRMLFKKAKDLNAVPICVTQSTRYYKNIDGRVLGAQEKIPFGDMTANGVDYFHMMRLLNQATLQVCKEQGGIPVDLAGAVQWNDDDFYDFIHNTPSGAKKIGDYLYSKLRNYF